MSKERVIQTFIDLVQIDSPTGLEADMTAEVYKRLSILDLEPEVDNLGNVICFVKGDSNKVPIFLNAHLDTVEPGRGIDPYIDSQGWIRSKGETILGADNKSAVAAILEMLFRLKETENESHHPLEVVFTVSEESGNHGAHGLDYKRLKATNGFIFDASDREFGSVIISSPFYNRFDLSLLGTPAHASRPEFANNVIPPFAQAITQLQLGRQPDGSLVNIGIVRSGNVVNTVPGKINVSGEVRSMVEKDLEKHTANVIKTFSSVAEQSNILLENKIVRENDGYEISETDPFLIKTVELLNAQGIKPDLIRSWGCYEANIFAAHGIVVLNIADGSLDTHTENERIHINDLIKLSDLAYGLIL